MSNVVVVGSQWGDEGKGKIVDWLCEKADIVVRFQGGHNAGHTIVVDEKEYKLSLLPSGVVRGEKLGVIGNGVVVDPKALFEEIDRVKEQGINVTNENLKIAENANLILPLHQELDALREDAVKGTKIGTTRRGIGPAYEDKVGRRGIRVVDLQDKDVLKMKIERLLLHHNALLRGFGKTEIKLEELYDYLCSLADRILDFCAPVSSLLHEEQKKGKKILFEGAQGSLLDIDHGTYPFVTSSNVIAGQAAIGSGMGPDSLNFVLGITKAYTTRVGEGPFPTEQDNEIGQFLGEAGHEFGTVTGRKRRCGWFDAALVKHAVRINGINGIALTKLDVLDGLKEIKIGVGYKYKNKEINHFSMAEGVQANMTPIYKTLEGWSKTTKGVREISGLPQQAIKYIETIENLIGVKVSLLSTSAHRDDTITIKNPFG